MLFRSGGNGGAPSTSCAGGGGGGGFGRGGGAGGVTPGTYNVTLTVNGKSYSKPVTVLADIWRGDK